MPEKLSFWEDRQVQAESWDDGKNPFTIEGCVVSDKAFSSIFEQNTNNPVAKSKWADDGKEFAQIETRADDGAKETLQMTCPENPSALAQMVVPVYIFDEEANRYKANWKNESVEYTYQLAAKSDQETVDMEIFKDHVNTLINQQLAALAEIKQDVSELSEKGMAENGTNNEKKKESKMKESSTSSTTRSDLSQDEINKLVNKQVTSLKGENIGTIDLAGDGFPEVFEIQNAQDENFLTSEVTFYEYKSGKWEIVLFHRFEGLNSDEIERMKFIEDYPGNQILIGGVHNGSLLELEFIIVGNISGKVVETLFNTANQTAYPHPSWQINGNTFEVWGNDWDGTVYDKDIYYWNGDRIIFRTEAH